MDAQSATQAMMIPAARGIAFCVFRRWRGATPKATGSVVLAHWAKRHFWPFLDALRRRSYRIQDATLRPLAETVCRPLLIAMTDTLATAEGDSIRTDLGAVKNFPLRSCPTDTSPIVQISLSIADWQNLGSQLGIHLSSVQRGRCWGNPEVTLWLTKAINAQVSSQTLALEALEAIQQAVIEHEGEPLLVIEKLDAILEGAGFSLEGDC